METGINKDVNLIREVFNYSRKFRGATFVFKIDCALLEDPFFPSMVRDLALLHSNNINIVLIAGAKSKIDEVLELYGVNYDFESGVRISSDEAIQFIKMAAFDVSNRIMTLLSSQNINAVIGNWVRARSMGVINGRDYKKTGLVEKINVDLVKKVQSEGLIPILPCIGWSRVGTPYNISSNELARIASVQLGADKLFFLNSFSGLYVKDFAVPQSAHVAQDGRISRLGTVGARDFIKKNSKSDNPNMEYIELAIGACEGGVKRVHILDGRIDGVILKEIFSGLGSGIMIHSNIYESIRKMRLDDVTEVFGVMKPQIEQGILVPRTEDDLREKYGDYYIYEVDGAIHGCAAFHDFGEGVGEIAGIAVNQLYSHLGIGQKLVEYIIDDAVKMKFGRIFALTTQALDWFEQLGFREGTVEDLPSFKKENYNRQRNSKIVYRDI